MACFAPSEIPGVDATTAGAFGLIAEGFIAAKYLEHRKRRVFFPLSETDFLDISVGFGNSALHISFLCARNPSLSPAKLTWLSLTGQLKVPDLLTDDGPIKEFYEIKPNSTSGRTAGRTKIANLDAVYTHLALPYAPGILWRPNSKETVFEGPIFGVRIKVFFHFFRTSAGLIVYQLCIDGDLEKLSDRVLIAILMLIMMLLFRRGRIPMPGPRPMPVPIA